MVLKGVGLEDNHADILGGLTFRDPYRVCACNLIPSLSLTPNEKKGIGTSTTELIPLLVKYTQTHTVHITKIMTSHPPAQAMIDSL